MAVHNNPEIAELFDYLSRMSDLHAQEVEERAKGITLPADSTLGFQMGRRRQPRG
jgi:hypothetical protein